MKNHKSAVFSCNEGLPLDEFSDGDLERSEISIHIQSVYPALYNAFAQFCDSLEELIVLCGIFLGGVLALYFIEHPDYICAVVLIASQYKMPKRIL